MTDYSIYIGFEHLHRLHTCASLSFDVETLQLQPEYGKLRLIQFGCTARKMIVVVDMFEASESDLYALTCFFDTPRFWTAHNAVFDLGWLQEYGWYPKNDVRCTMIGSKLLNNGMPNVRHGLKDVVKRYLDVDLDKTEQKSDWSGDLTESQICYAAKDVEMLCEFEAEMCRELVQQGLGKAYSLECRALPALAAMNRTGLPFDREQLQQVEKDYAKDVENISREFYLELDDALPREAKLPRDPDGSFNLRARDSGSVRAGTKKFAGFNIASPKQLLEKLTLVLGYAPEDPKTQKPSASRMALKEYAAEHSVISTYLDYKRAEKRRQMVVSLPEHQSPDGFIRASFWQLGAETGRMACSKPNLQQIPRDQQFREAVVAPAGWKLVNADFSQMELRLLAVETGDENMCTAFIDGEDLHTVTAEALVSDRQVAKSANFGLAYGSGAKGLRNYAAGMGVRLSLEEASQVREQWLNTYSGVREWHRKLGRLSDKTQGQMPSIRVRESAFRRYLVGDMNRLTIRANTPIQGAGAAILKKALGSLWKQMQGNDNVKLCGAVHDEILLLVREGLEDEWAHILKTCMEAAEATWLGDVPAIADVKVGSCWAETH